MENSLTSTTRPGKTGPASGLSARAGHPEDIYTMFSPNNTDVDIHKVALGVHNLLKNHAVEVLLVVELWTATL